MNEPLTPPTPPALADEQAKRSSRAATGYAALRAEAEAAAAQWEPFTQNHCPSYWNALREAWASGYVSGASAAARRHSTEVTDAGPVAQTQPNAIPGVRVN